MRVIKQWLASAGMLLSTVVTSMGLTTIATAIAAQDAPIKIDVHTSESHTVWYTDPKWLAIGGIVVLLVIVLAIMAARGRGRSTTTVIR